MRTSTCIRRLVLALLHPELASCERLSVEGELVVVFPDLSAALLRERVEGVLRGDWGEQGGMLYPPPVECEGGEMDLAEEQEEQEEQFEFDPPPGEPPEEPPQVAVEAARHQTFTHLQKLEVVRVCREQGGDVADTARRAGLPVTRLRRWLEAEQVLEEQVRAGEGNRSKAVSLRPKQLRPFEERLLAWLVGREGEGARLARGDVSRRAIELYREEVADVGAQKRFKAGATYVEQFLAKTKTRHLVGGREEPEVDNGKVFPCDECDQTFPKNSLFKQHKLENHYSEKPFACPHCGRCFKSTENLKIHIRTHTGEKPYSCSICGYASADPSNFRKHQKNHHQDVISQTPGRLKRDSDFVFKN